MKLSSHPHRVCALGAACLALALCPLVAAGTAPGAQRRRDLADPHEVLFAGSLLREVTRTVSVREAAAPAGLARANLTTSPDGRYQAFTVEDPSRGNGFFDRIFFADLRSGRTFEIRNLPDPHRPFNDLTFTRATVLQFDRWSGPHNGIRYRLDVRRRRLISARAFYEAEYGFPRKRLRKSQR